MSYSFSKNLKLKKYYVEPLTKYNVVSTVIFRLENNYKPMKIYVDQFLCMIENFVQIFDSTYYLRVYFDRSVYIKTGNELIDREIDTIFVPLFRKLKNIPFVQLCRYDHRDFKKNKIFHIGLFGTLIRFLPLFDCDENKLIKTVIISDIDVCKKYISLTQKCLKYTMTHKLKFFFRTSFCKFIAGRHYVAQNIANTWLRVMAGTVICDDYKFPVDILDDFFYKIKFNIRDENIDKFIKMDILNMHDYKTSSEDIFKYGIDEFFAMYLLKDILAKHIKFGYLSTNDVDAPIYFAYHKSNKFADNKPEYTLMMKELLKEYYDDTKSVQDNYKIYEQTMNTYYKENHVYSEMERNVKKYTFDFFQKIKNENTYANYGLMLDE